LSPAACRRSGDTPQCSTKSASANPRPPAEEPPRRALLKAPASHSVLRRGFLLPLPARPKWREHQTALPMARPVGLEQETAPGQYAAWGRFHDTKGRFLRHGSSNASQPPGHGRTPHNQRRPTPQAPTPTRLIAGTPSVRNAQAGPPYVGQHGAQAARPRCRTRPTSP